jgi:hypothetical protein
MYQDGGSSNRSSKNAGVEFSTPVMLQCTGFVNIWAYPWQELCGAFVNVYSSRLIPAQLLSWSRLIRGRRKRAGLA